MRVNASEAVAKTVRYDTAFKVWCDMDQGGRKLQGTHRFEDEEEEERPSGLWSEKNRLRILTSKTPERAECDL